MFLSERLEFPSAPCLAGKETWHLASRFCWNRARPWHASQLVPFLVELRTYQHPGVRISDEFQGFITVRQVEEEFRLAQRLKTLFKWKKLTEPIHKNTVLEVLIRHSSPKTEIFLGLPALQNTWRNAKRCCIQEQAYTNIIQHITSRPYPVMINKHRCRYVGIPVSDSAR